jgi:hypothetical protein
MTSAIETKKVAIPAKGNAGHHLSLSLLHLLQSRLLLLRQIQAQDSMQGILELRERLKQLRRQADLFADLLEPEISADHISKWVGAALEEVFSDARGVA